MKPSKRLLTVIAVLFSLIAISGGALYAQLEGPERGVPPIDSESTLEVTGVRIDVVGNNAELARYEGWRRAQAIGWRALWASMNKRPASEAPALPESTLSSIVSGIVIEDEQIGPKRYIAQLGVLFDRARTGPFLGVVDGPVRRSEPMLVIPVMITGGTPYTFEFRNEWQKAWARFRTNSSEIDYVRTAGSGVEPLLFNIMQTKRPGRGWWRMLLDQYGAADVVIPEVRLQRAYPGGPAIGVFTARFGPDNRTLGSVTLRVSNSASIGRLMDEGIRRLDRIYSDALAAGLLRPDPSLIVERSPLSEDLAEEIEAANAATVTDIGPIPTGPAVAYNILVDTPDAAAVNRAELSVSRVRGVTSALTTSLALGGTSTIRATFAGDENALATGLQAQGWSVQVSGNTLRISRSGGGN